MCLSDNLNKASHGLRRCDLVAHDLNKASHGLRRCDLQAMGCGAVPRCLNKASHGLRRCDRTPRATRAEVRELDKASHGLRRCDWPRWRRRGRVSGWTVPRQGIARPTTVRLAIYQQRRRSACALTRHRTAYDGATTELTVIETNVPEQLDKASHGLRRCDPDASGDAAITGSAQQGIARPTTVRRPGSAKT